MSTRHDHDAIQRQDCQCCACDKWHWSIGLLLYLMGRSCTCSCERILCTAVYRFGPLPQNAEYRVTAQKTGYILDRDDVNPLNFKVFKLAEVSVNVCWILTTFNAVWFSHVLDCLIAKRVKLVINVRRFVERLEKWCSSTHAQNVFVII